MLKDITVLDFSRLLPGPYATMLLADMGMNVIKIEDPQKGDYMRDFPPIVDGMGAFYLASNRGKKSLAVDYRSDEGRKIIYKMIEKSHVIIESFRPGAMQAFGLDYVTVKKINPKIISWFSIIGSQYYLAGKEIVPGQLTFAEGVICYNIYETKDKRYISLGALEQKFWAQFCNKISRQDLVDKQFEKAEKNNSYYLEIQEIFKAKTLQEWVGLFEKDDICLTPILTSSEALESQYTKDNATVFEVKNILGKTIKQVHSPISKNFADISALNYPPARGEQTEEILKAFNIKA